MKERYQVRDMYAEVDDGGRITRLTKFDRATDTEHHFMPTRWSRTRKIWEDAQGVKLSTFRAGLSRGTYDVREIEQEEAHIQRKGRETMSKRYETEHAIWWAKERVDILVETYEMCIEEITKDIEEAQKKDREYSEGIYKGQRMTYKLAIRDLKELRQNIEAIEKAMA